MGLPREIKSLWRASRIYLRENKYSWCGTLADSRETQLFLRERVINIRPCTVKILN